MNTYKYLAISDDKAKRITPEDKHPIRSEFARDRDRIMYSKAFRRLSGKTQVFLAGNDDHVRTRLTHTLEVAQISRTIANALGLNEELTEAIALGHDIGHTPFGHVGERMLNNIMNGCYTIQDFNELSEEFKKIRGFKHNWQSVRVAVELESSMNLTDYTLWGMLNHSSITLKSCKMKNENKLCFLRHGNPKECDVNLEDESSLSFYRSMDIDNNNLYDKIKDKWSFEGLIVALADEVAQRHHDIEDALEYNIIDKGELDSELKKIFEFNDNDEGFYRYKQEIQKKIKEENAYVLNDLFSSIKNEEVSNFKEIKNHTNLENIDLYKSKVSKFIVNMLTTDIIYNTKNNFNTFIEKYGIKSNEDFYKFRINIEKNDIKEKDYKDLVSYSEYMKDADNKLQSFLKDRILNSHKAQTMDGVGQHIITQLFKAYVINPQQLPDKTIIKLFKNIYKFRKQEWEEDKCSVGKLRSKLQREHFGGSQESGSYEVYKLQLLRTICDYIAGMTDKYTIEQHRKLYNIV